MISINLFASKIISKALTTIYSLFVLTIIFEDFNLFYEYIKYMYVVSYLFKKNLSSMKSFEIFFYFFLISKSRSIRLFYF